MIKRLENLSHQRGQEIARKARAAIYGSRETIDTDAGTAPDRRTMGVAPHSVWQGPRQIRSGAPVLRRH